MSDWDIKPDGVRGVLSKRRSSRRTVTAWWAPPRRWARWTENDLKFLPVRAGKSITGARLSVTGARLATEEYVKGDLEMAANKRKEYSKAPTAEEVKGPKK
ncbi:DUF6507 family protein [Streptomyces sp. HUAS TT3]|uniref:DUF6507 family protein n=1 Tax=Streptomyces sp. HUAS TT3 TaxID=3447510 RepID=UPI003F65F3AB